MRASDPRRPMDAFAFGTMLVLCALWGTQQVIIKVTARDVAPVMQTALRTGISAAFLFALVLVRGEGASFRWHTWRAGLFVGVLFGVEFIFIAEALRYTSASHVSVFLYTAPVFAALGLHLLLPAERLGRVQWLGITVAFGGIVVAFAGGLGASGFSLRILLGDALGVLAGAIWGSTTVTIRASSLSEAPPSQTLLYHLAIGFFVQLAYAMISGQAGQVVATPLAWASLLFQGILVSFASYLVWIWLLQRYLATRLAVFALLTPLFGVAAGVVLLHDPVDAGFVGGSVLVLLGIAIVSGGPLLRARPPRAWSD